jgi:hypothetical protein
MIRRSLRACAFAFAVVLLTAAPSRAASIGIADGFLAGYIPLATLGVTPETVTPDGFVTFNNVPAVHFGGETFTTVSMNENGFLVLGDAPIGMDTKTNLRLPDSGLPMPILAPLWTDLSGGEMRAANVTDGVSNWLVFEWTSMNAPALIGRFTFQVWLGQNNEDITFAYLQRPQSGQLTIGAQDKTGTVGKTLYFNGRGILPLNDLRVATDGLPLPNPDPVPVPEPATLTLLAGGLAFSAISRLRKDSAKRR